MNRYKSHAQKMKFQELYQGGKITKETLNEWSTNSKGRPIPNRITKPKTKKMKHNQY